MKYNIAFILILVFSCNTNDRMVEKEFVKEELYKSIGVYHSKEDSLFFEVDYIENELKFKLLDSQSKLLFQSKELSISKFHRWCFLMDRLGTVWVYSSDVGLFTLRKNLNEYKLVNFGIINLNNKARIPIKVFNFFPSSLKNSLN